MLHDPCCESFGCRACSLAGLDCLCDSLEDNHLLVSRGNETISKFRGCWRCSFFVTAPLFTGTLSKEFFDLVSMGDLFPFFWTLTVVLHRLDTTRRKAKLWTFTCLLMLSGLGAITISSSTIRSKTRHLSNTREKGWKWSKYNCEWCFRS